MLSKLLILAAIVAAETILEVALIYLSARYGPLPFDFRLTPKVGLAS